MDRPMHRGSDGLPPQNVPLGAYAGRSDGSDGLQVDARSFEAYTRGSYGSDGLQQVDARPFEAHQEPELVTHFYNHQQVEAHKESVPVSHSYNNQQGGGHSPLLAATAITPPSTSGAAAAAASTAKVTSRRRQALLHIAVVVAVAVVAALLGGVVGWQITEKKPAVVGGSDNVTRTEECPSDPANDSSTNGASRAIRPNSALAAVGWRTAGSDDYSIKVFYQGPDARLMTSSCSSWFNWTTPRAMAVGIPAGAKLVAGATNGAEPQSNTPLAASVVLWWDDTDRNNPNLYQPAVQLLYLSHGGKIRGQNWREYYSISGRPDALNDGRHDGTILSSQTGAAAFWPYYFFQNAENKILEVADSEKKGAIDKIGPLTTLEASPGTPLLAMPLESNLESNSTGKQLRLFYRTAGEGRLAVLARSKDGTILASSGLLQGAEGGSIAIPAASPLAGFARANKAGGGLDTFLLWQDADGKIYFTTSTTPVTGGGSWTRPATDPVFGNADSKTHIVCVTAATGGVLDENRAPLTANTDLSRCFFQAGGGKLKQVRHDGDGWVDEGFVSMP